MSRAATHSQHWYRVAQLRPRVTRHVSVHRQQMRGEVDHVMRDSASGRMVRLNESAYQIAGRMNGDTTLDEIWHTVRAERGADAPTQTETIEVLSSLVERGLVRCETTPETLDILDNEEALRGQDKAGGFNPMALRIPLGNPSAWLDRVLRYVPALPGTVYALAWLGLALAGLAAVSDQGGALSAHARQLIGSPRAVLLLWLLYPIVKALHELAHAAVLRRCGGTVREMGITLMMGVPVPFVDASDASAFALRHQRVAVAAAGILAELALAALATLVWVAVQPGLVRDAALTVMLIGTVSTLLFNGNPLMRMDGYHILADAIGVPQLAQRSREAVRDVAVRLFVGVRRHGQRDMGRWERAGLFAYGAASGLYRLFVGVAVVMWAASFSTLLAVAMGLAFAFASFWRPLTDALQFLLVSSALSRGRSRYLARTAGIVLASLIVIAWVPLPMSVGAQGVVWIPSEAETRSNEDGFIDKVLVSDGATVSAGQALMTLVEPHLVAQREQALQRMNALDVEYHSVIFSDPAKARTLARNIESARAEADRFEARLAGLVVRAGAAGTVSIQHAADLPERFVKKGSIVAHVIGDDLMRVRAVVDEGDVELIRGSLRSATVRVADRLGDSWDAQLLRETPQATRKLPNAVLGEQGGGNVPIDSSDKEGVTALRPVHVLDLKLPRASVDALGGRLGTRAYVSFELPAQPLLAQTERAIRQLFLRYFSRES